MVPVFSRVLNFTVCGKYFGSTDVATPAILASNVLLFVGLLTTAGELNGTGLGLGGLIAAFLVLLCLAGANAFAVFFTGLTVGLTVDLTVDLTVGLFEAFFTGFGYPVEFAEPLRDAVTCLGVFTEPAF